MKFGDFRRKDNGCLHHLYWYASSAHSVPTPHTVQVWSIVYFRRGHAKCPLLDKRTSPHFLFYIIPLMEVGRGKQSIFMKKFLLCALIVIVGCCTFTSCEKEGSMSKSEIAGEWQAKIVYSSDNSVTHNLTLRNNGTATYERITTSSIRDYYGYGNLYWHIDGKQIICEGVFTNGEDVNPFFTLTLHIEGNTLKYGDYIFHKVR